MNFKMTSWQILKIFIVTLLGILLIDSSAFCFSVTAQVDRNRITINDSVELSVVFKDGEGQVDTSPITDFSIVSQSSSSNISIINGKYSKTFNAIYTLIPKKEGTLRIPQLKAEYKNRIYTTEEILIEVSAQAAHSSDSRDIFVEAGISGTSLFTGQQAVYQLRLYSAVRYSNATLQPPSFKGFTAKEAGDRKNYRETINGRSYSVTQINYVIIPEVSGELQIDPALITCDVAVRRNSRDPFDDPFFSNGLFSFGRAQTRQFSTGPVMVKVDPLPPYSESSIKSSGLTASSSSAQSKIPFSGLVGNFSIKASLDNLKLKTGDSATLTITISGTGNLMDAKMPVVAIPAQFKVYDDSPEEKINLTLDGYSGEKIFKMAIVPIEPGKYTIPSVILSFFNVSTHSYETISTDPVTIEVGQSTEQATTQQQHNTVDNFNSGQPGADNKMAREKKKVEFAKKDILSIKEDASILVSTNKLSLLMFLSLFFLPCGLFFILRFFMAISKREISVSTQMLNKAKMDLKAAEQIIKNEHGKNGVEIQSKIKDTQIKSNHADTTGISPSSNDFFKLLHDSLIAMVMSKSGSRGKSITADEVTRILTSAGSSFEAAGEVSALLNEIESARYGREESDPDYRKELLVKAKKLFQTLGVLIVAFSLFLSAYPEQSFADTQESSSPSATLFLEAVHAYHNGDFVQSAQKFSLLAQREIKNPYLYYNIGNAYIKAGDTGRAILWYERAKREIPRDPDLIFNLEYAKGFVTDKVESSGIDITGLIFFWKDYFPPETVQYCAIVLSFIFFFYAAIRIVVRKKIFTPAGVVVFSALVITGCTAIYSYYHQSANHFAVVISKEASVRSGISEDATKLFILHAGTRVKVADVRNGYLKILFSKDKIGWISTQDAEVI